MRTSPPRPNRQPNRPVARHRTETGSVTIWMLLWLPVLLLGLGAIVDYGAAIRARALASDAAFGAARAGAVEVVAVTGQGTQLDQADATVAAHTYIDQVDVPPSVALAASVQTTPTSVTVTVTVTYDPQIIQPLAATFTRSETAQMQVGQ